jgi:arylsulfatase A-like enzyme
LCSNPLPTKSVLTKRNLKGGIMTIPLPGRRPLSMFGILLILFCLSSCSQSQPESSMTEKRPNFLIFTTDDMGYTDFGAFGGNDIPTPNIDEIAMQGVRLTNFHVSISCAPTRSMLMSGTGNHEAGMGIQNINFAPEFRGQRGYEGQITDRVLTLPERMRGGGYNTYMSGKWHLGSELGENTPADRGFERTFALMSGGSSDHFRPDHLEQMPYLLDGEMIDSLPEDFYSTNAYVDHMIEFIQDGEADDQPFFAWFAPTSPHWPLQVYPGWEDKFVGYYDEGYEALCHARQQGAAEMGVLPANADTTICPEEASDWEDLSEEDKQLHRRTMELYAAMTAHLDTEFGRLLDYLEASGQLENTYIIYHNDNGSQGGEIMNNRGNQDRYDNSIENIGQRNSWVHLGQGWSDAQSAPFREDKGSQYEGGIRVPAFIRAPSSSDSARISNSLLTVMDVMPTIMDLAGIEEVTTNTEGASVLPIRGQSFAGLLEDQNYDVHAGQHIALDEGGESILIEGDWKIIRQPQQANWELYRLDSNPNETQNLADQYPEIVAELAAKFDAHAETAGILRRDQEGEVWSGGGLL